MFYSVVFPIYFFFCVCYHLHVKHEQNMTNKKEMIIIIRPFCATLANTIAICKMMDPPKQLIRFTLHSKLDDITFSSVILFLLNAIFSFFLNSKSRRFHFISFNFGYKL